MQMAMIGRFHPLLVHFPIALVIAAALAEGLALAMADERWRTVAIVNLRAGAVFALFTAIAGWRFASEMDASTLLEWHQWLGTIAAAAAALAALATLPRRQRVEYERRIYRVGVFAAGILMAAAGHFGGLLVWGANFLRP
jgi:uncharacterized membrane protein